nr:AraC family transcriptional regulator [Nocardia sp. BMG51109]
MQQASAPSHVTVSGPGGTVQARVDAWEFGRASLTRVRASGLRLVRTTKRIRTSPSPMLGINIQEVNTARLGQAEVQHTLVPGSLFWVDLNLPYDLYSCGATALQVPLDVLGLPAETIRRAIVRPEDSPLSPMVANHIAWMVGSADTLHADPATRELGDVCTELVRALIISITTGNGDGAALPAEVLLTEIRGYVRRHLTDPDLDPPRIARAHNISLRYLYKLCAQADFGLGQWIIGQRLHRARCELANPEHRHRPIAVIAQRWGFRDPSHFGRRFRAAYGMTPRQWRNSADSSEP